ncbi:formyltransferase family protein [Magnetofaba australis]|uniref:Putative methionyl-tRNA formyltranserase n=1 Tax=Magnetofaba australis IT-1 TaxID=1434232 RepID=A0A1Y2K469_9PROT|nr:formyltransferase family protein [Magnetofaba australis]OSM01924.1 putative methionyl-tRNA formyltranserase [Magnetofaba australis IT-1]
MRILFITSTDRVYAPRFFAEFLRLNAGADTVLVATTPLAAGVGFVWRRLVSFPRYFAPLLLLQAWRAAVPPAGGGLDAVCRRHGAERRHLPRVDDAALPALIEQFAPDCLISMGCPRILPAAVVRDPRYAAWNFHGGRIPRYRGAMTPMWALAEGTTPVLTWHRMVARVDAGGIIAQRPLPLAPGESFHHYSSRLLGEAAALLADALRAPPPPTEPELAESRYYDWPTAQQGRALRQRGAPLWIGKRS